MRSILAVVLVGALLGGCGGDGGGDGSEPAATTTAAPPRNAKYDLTFRDWEGSTLTQAEADFERVTRTAFGIGTNPPKMLEIGYDLCEQYELHPDQSKTQLITEYAGANSIALGSAMSVGLPATKYLCP